MSFTEIKRPSRLKAEKEKLRDAVTTKTNTIALPSGGTFVMPKVPAADNEHVVAKVLLSLVVAGCIITILFQSWGIVDSIANVTAENFSPPWSSLIFIFVLANVILVTTRILDGIRKKEGAKETREEVEGMAKFENYKDAYTVEKDDNDDDEEDEGTYVRRNVTKIFSFSPGNDKFTIGLSLNVSDNTETYWYRDAGAKGHKVTSRICSEDSNEFIEVISSAEYNSEPRMEKWYDEDNDKTLYVFLVPETWDLKVIQTN